MKQREGMVPYTVPTDEELARITSVRAMKDIDLDACQRIFLNARRKAFHWVDRSRFMLEDFQRQTCDEQVWLAEAGSEVVGFIAVYLPDNFIHHLFVAPGHEDKGVGTELLHFALQRLTAPVDLKCCSANIPACRFYEKRGWRAVERAVDEEMGEFVRYRWDGNAAGQPHATGRTEL